MSAKPKMTTGPLGQYTRAELANLVSQDRRRLVTDDELAQIEAGELGWSFERELTGAVGGNLELLRQQSEEKARLKRFVIQLRPTKLEPWELAGHGALIDNAQGLRVLNAMRFDEAVSRRGAVASDLFAEGKPEDWIGVDPTPTWGEFQLQFREAAELLSRSPHPPVHAFLFNCRQHLELLLKSIIVRGRELLGETGPFPTGHSLEKLCKLALPILERMSDETWSAVGAPAGKAACDVVLALDRLDPNSEVFRYPVDKKGGPMPQPQELANFSVPDTWARFEQASDFFQEGFAWIELRLYVNQREAEEAKHAAPTPGA